jgi:chromosome segregation ATPase
MDTLIRRPSASVRGPFWALVLPAFLVGAVGASVLFVGVWRNEASRAKSADSEASKAAAVLSATADKLSRAQARLRVTRGKLRESQATVQGQADLVRRLGAAGKPILNDAAGLDSASQQLATEGAGLGAAVTKLTNAVAALGVYLKQTSPSELDPAYLDAQLSYLEQALASLQARSERVTNGAGSVAAHRRALQKDVAALEQLARGR